MIAFFLYLIGESRYPLTSPFVFRDLEKKRCVFSVSNTIMDFITSLIPDPSKLGLCVSISHFTCYCCMC